MGGVLGGRGAGAEGSGGAALIGRCAFLRPHTHPLRRLPRWPQAWRPTWRSRWGGRGRAMCRRLGPHSSPAEVPASPALPVRPARLPHPLLKTTPHPQICRYHTASALALRRVALEDVRVRDVTIPQGEGLIALNMSGAPRVCPGCVGVRTGALAAAALDCGAQNHPCPAPACARRALTPAPRCPPHHCPTPPQPTVMRRCFQTQTRSTSAAQTPASRWVGCGWAAGCSAAVRG